MKKFLLNLKYLFIPIKRIFFLFSNVIKYLFNGIFWLLNSKEHTNFSFNMNNIQTNIISYIASTFYELNHEDILKDVENIQNLKIRKESKDLIKTIDLDYKPKWDYRLLPYILVKNNKIKNIFEFGIDQGRIGYLLSLLIPNNSFLNFNYLGIESNNRKGVLLKNNKFENIELVFDTLQSYISKINTDKLADSLVISSTHEFNSEKYLFNFLESNKILPKYLISDNCSENSEYFKFVKNNPYSYTIIPIEDPNKFLGTIYIGIAKLSRA